MFLYQTTIAIYNVLLMVTEAKVVDLALDFMRTCDTSNKFIIFFDSLSLLKAMNHTSSKTKRFKNF